MPEAPEAVKCDICETTLWGPVAYYEGKKHCADCCHERERGVKPILDWPLIRSLVKLFR